MDVFNLKSFVLFLSVFGCCTGQDLLPHDVPLEGVVEKTITIIPSLEPGETFLTLSWNFHGGEELVPIGGLAVLPTGVNEKIEDDYVGRVDINQTTGALTLGPLRITDSGDYAISIVNSKGESQTGESTLQVLVPVSDVAIKSTATEAVEGNSTTVLTCTAKGSFIKFVWLNGATPIVSGPKLTVADSETETSSTLTVKNPLRTDVVGPISCSASNKLGTVKSEGFNLSISYGPEKVALTATPVIPPSMVIATGGSLTLTCGSLSSPAATIAWHHNGAARAETTAALVLAKLTEAESGNYSCVVNNAKTGRTVSSNIVQFTVMEPVSGTKLTGPTETLLAGGNQTASLSCQATAGKVTKQAWFKDGVALSPSDRVKVAGDKVTITPLQKEDNGAYRCDLSNAVNTDSATYNLVVNYGPEAAAVAGEGAVEINDEVKLTCAVKSVPAATYVWKFNGTKTDVTTAEYSIDKATYKNSGTYTCEATNAVTGLSTSAVHKLSVKEEGALEEGLSDGAIAGIVIAVLVLVAAAIGGVFYWLRRPDRTSYAATATEPAPTA